MELNLIRTEYSIDCKDHKLKGILGYQGGKATVDVFIDDSLVYYYVIEDFRELVLDDYDLLNLVTKKIKEDRTRWIKDCTFIEDYVKDFKLKNKVAVYSAKISGYEFILKISTMDYDGEKYVFRLQYTNNLNKDILDCYVEAKNYEELIGKSFIYANTITNISEVFIKNQKEFMNNAFSKCYKKH